MQYLFMTATFIRENQMKKMAKEIIKGSISIEQAMINYNVFSREGVIKRVNMLEEELEYQDLLNQVKVTDYKIQAA